MRKMPVQPALSPAVVAALQAAFGARLQRDVPMLRFTAARLGGPADYVLGVSTLAELEGATRVLWQLEAPFIVLGGGSNILVSDAGFRGVVVLNEARQVRFENESVTPGGPEPSVWAEAGANFGLLARQAALRGLAGLEWAAGIPGTVGGAVVGNAGAHGGDVAGNLLMAVILQWNQSAGALATSIAPIREVWAVEKFQYAYRTSLLKNKTVTGRPGQPVWLVLAARFGLERSSPQAALAKIEEFGAYRRQTQPPGASMGSMFKNPPTAVSALTAGQLIDQAGLKGTRCGAAEISPLHGNFFINHGAATAADVYRLIEQAQHVVAEKFGVRLELEVELVGSWDLVPVEDPMVNGS